MSNGTFRLWLVSLLAALSCVAQTSTSTLTGTIYDNSGAVVAGAIVTVTNSATGVAQKQLANSAGLFAFPSIAIGTYTVSVEMAGFKTTRRTNVVLEVNTPTALSITLELGDTREVVKVEAVVEQLNTSNATLGNVVQKETVVNLGIVNQ